MNDEFFMGLALEEAEKAFDQGEFPVGCVIVQAGKVIATGARAGTGDDMPFFSEISHAEIRALQSLEVAGSGFDPDSAVLYCTMEPCLMCFGAIMLSGIKKIVYAYEDAMGGGTKCDLEKMPPLYADCQLDIRGGVLRQKSLDLFCEFFNKENNLYWKDSYLEKYTLDQIDNNNK